MKGCMKNFLKILLLAIILTAFSTPILAANHTYKIYNQKLNKTVSVELGTISVAPDRYLWGFFLDGGTPYCIVNLKTDVKDKLVGGKCMDFNSFVKIFIEKEKGIPLEYSWREYSMNTVYPELESLKKERAKEGKYNSLVE